MLMPKGSPRGWEIEERVNEADEGNGASQVAPVLVVWTPRRRRRRRGSRGNGRQGAGPGPIRRRRGWVHRPRARAWAIKCTPDDGVAATAAYVLLLVMVAVLMLVFFLHLRYPRLLPARWQGPGSVKMWFAAAVGTVIRICTEVLGRHVCCKIFLPSNDTARGVGVYGALGYTSAWLVGGACYTVSCRPGGMLDCVAEMPHVNSPKRKSRQSCRVLSNVQGSESGDLK
jgi:hypothetical protein